MENIEVKVRMEDLDAARERARVLGAAWIWTRRQRDVFFSVPRGYLKLRSSEGEPGELIAYARDPGSGPRRSRYHIALAPDPGALETVLSASLPVAGFVEKTRELHQWRHTRIHLDRVAGLGSFLELETVAGAIDLEAARRESHEAVEALGLDPAGFQDRPYLELLASQRD